MNNIPDELLVAPPPSIGGAVAKSKSSYSNKSPSSSLLGRHDNNVRLIPMSKPTRSKYHRGDRSGPQSPGDGLGSLGSVLKVGGGDEEMIEAFEAYTVGVVGAAGKKAPPPVPKAKFGAAPPKRLYKGSFREANHRTVAQHAPAEVFPQDLKPVDSPRHSLSLALNNLNSSEWETNLDGFRLLVRLTRHHPESLRNDLHNININGLRHLMNLRSQVCRAASLFFKELFLSQGKLMEQDVEKICEKLFDKTADTNKFIREDSASAIETLVLQLTPNKVLACIDSYGLKHRNPIVRASASRMLLLMVRRLGSERSLYDYPDRILPMLTQFLQEGSLDARTHAKAALAELVSHEGFEYQLQKHVSSDTLRNVSKSIASIRSEVDTLFPYF